MVTWYCYFYLQQDGWWPGGHCLMFRPIYQMVIILLGFLKVSPVAHGLILVPKTLIIVLVPDGRVSQFRGHSDRSEQHHQPDPGSAGNRAVPGPRIVGATVRKVFPPGC